MNRGSQITRTQTRGAEGDEKQEGMKEKSAGLEGFVPEVTRQRKFPRESSLRCYLPIENTSMFQEKSACSSAAEQARSKEHSH